MLNTIDMFWKDNSCPSSTGAASPVLSPRSGQFDLWGLAAPCNWCQFEAARWWGYKDLLCMQGMPYADSCSNGWRVSIPGSAEQLHLNALLARGNPTALFVKSSRLGSGRKGMMS